MRSIIGRRVFWSILLIQSISLLIVLSWYFYVVLDQVTALSEERAHSAVAEIIERTEGFFEPAERATMQAARHIEQGLIGREDLRNLELYFFDQLRQQQQFAGMFVGWPDGEFHYVMRREEISPGGFRTKLIDIGAKGRRVEYLWRDSEGHLVKREIDPGDDYDPRTRPWYKAVEISGKLSWSEPYIFYTSRQPGITVAAPVKQEDQLIAVVGIDIELTEISRLLGQISVGSGGLTTIFDEKGRVLAHPNEDLVVVENAGSDNETLRYRTIGELGGVTALLGGEFGKDAQLEGGVPQVTVQSWQNTSYHIAKGRASVVDWPWLVGAVVPNKRLIDFGGADVAILLAVSLSVTILAAICALLVAQSIGKPLLLLQRNAEYARNGNLELMEDVGSGAPEIRVPADVLEDFAKTKRLGGHQDQD